MHLACRDVVARVGFEPRIPYAFHFGAGFEPLGHFHGVAAVLLDAQVEGFEASDVKPGVERGRNRAGRVLQEGHRVACFLVVQDHRAADHVRVAADVLGGGVDDHVGAVCERMLQYRGCEGVVHDHFGAVRVRHGRGGGDVGDVEQRVGRGFHPDVRVLLLGERG